MKKVIIASVIFFTAAAFGTAGNMIYLDTYFGGVSREQNGGGVAMTEFGLREFVFAFDDESSLEYSLNFLDGTSVSHVYTCEMQLPEVGWLTATTENPGENFPESFQIYYFFLDSDTAVLNMVVYEEKYLSEESFIMMGKKINNVPEQ